MQFQEHTHGLRVEESPSVYGIQQTDRIDRLDHVGIWKDKFEFVGLEMADEMPLDIRGHLRDFGGKFLGTALGKDALAGIIGLHQAFDRMEFGNCHQFHG